MKEVYFKGESILNVPNLISFYRLVISPFVFYLALSGQEKLFAIFLCISLVSDLLDGLIARVCKLQTKFGAALDNAADLCTYVIAIAGVYIFKWDDIEPHALVLFIFVISVLMNHIVSLVRFRKIPGLHIYSVVTSAYLQGIFLFILFAFDFYTWMYYTVIIWGILAYTEKIIILFLLDDIRSGVKGLYWLLRDRKWR